jgi:3-deoxy-manno-octulosonate cytidylyltransferase (CMP-KDO synthetase)
MSVLIVIPARMKATRLPNKPLADIGGMPMIVQVCLRAKESGVGKILVACDGEEIANAVRAAGFEAVVTDPEHPSGSDRIWEAIQTTGSTEDIIINLQGDVPTLEPRLLKELLQPLQNPAVDIATLAAEITRAEEHENPSVVKAVLSFASEHTLAGGDSPPLPLPLVWPSGSGSRGPSALRTDTDKIGRALYFTRLSAPYGEGPRYHHIGVYAYRRAALKTFVSLPPSPLEKREKLEQLRALEAGFRIDAVVVNTVPLGIDTPEDLERARKILG